MNIQVGFYVKLLYDYSELNSIKNDLNLILYSPNEHNFYYTSQHNRIYVLCIRNSNNFTSFSPYLKNEENDTETWETEHLAINVEEIESQSSNIYLYGSIFSIPKPISLKHIYINEITNLGKFISDENMISSQEAINIANSIYSHWNLLESEIDCRIYYTYSNGIYPVYAFNTDRLQKSFQKIWMIQSNNIYKDITILVNANTGEIINFY